MNYTNLEEVKTAYPIDDWICIKGKMIQITGYHFNGYGWWPMNVISDLIFNGEEIVKLERKFAPRY